MKILFPLLFLISCQEQVYFNWTPNTFTPNHEHQAIYSAHGDIVPFEDIEIEEFYCFPESNIAELAAEINKIQNKQIKDISIRKLNKIIRFEKIKPYYNQGQYQK